MNPPEDSPHNESPTAAGTAGTEPAGSDNREFERYVLVSALILLVLCLLWIDRRSELDNLERTGTDRVLRVEIGDSTGAPASRSSETDDAHASNRRRITPPAARRVPPPAETYEDARGDAPGTDTANTRGAGDTTALVRPYVPSQVPRLRQEETPAQSSERLYKVKPNDTLSGIASRELGRAGRAMEIARLNGISDPRRLRAGATIKLPRE